MELTIAFMIGTLFGLTSATLTFIASVRVVGNLHGINRSILTGRDTPPVQAAPLPFIVKGEKQEFEIESKLFNEPIPEALGR